MAQKIFRQGEKFYQAHRVLEDQMPVRIRENNPEPLALIEPSAVMASFSLELFLKSLLQEKQSSYPNHHNVSQLFSGLDQPIKDELAQRYVVIVRQSGTIDSLKLVLNWGRDRAKPPIDPTLVNALRQSSNTFDKWRYAYEHDGLQDTSSFAADAVRELILDRHPEWIKSASGNKQMVFQPGEYEKWIANQ